MRLITITQPFFFLWFGVMLTEFTLTDLLIDKSRSMTHYQKSTNGEENVFVTGKNNLHFKLAAGVYKSSSMLI